MSIPNIPDINPEITISINDSINLLLVSIALEEIGLSHILNAEGEKIQTAIGTLAEGIPPLATNIQDLIDIDKSVQETIKTVIKSQILLQFKLEEVINLIPCQVNILSRQVLSTLPGSSQQKFFGSAIKTSKVLAEVLVNGTTTDSVIIPVVNNQFIGKLIVPVGLPPEIDISIRVSSVNEPACIFEELVNLIPIQNE